MHRLVSSTAVRIGTAVAAVALVSVLAVGPADAHGTHQKLTVLVAHLDGQQEISPTGMPGAGDPDGRGTAIVVGSDQAPTSLCYLIFVRDIGTPVMAHIHMAPAGSNGSIVVNFNPPTGGFTIGCISEGDLLPNGNPVFNGVTVKQVLENPAGFYVNVHTTDFPAGAVRGQLRAA
jgi:hypothetical protein